MEISWHENALPIITTQISDSLTNTREMLRKESLPVGDIDVIVNGIEKQKVSKFRPTDEGFCYGKFKHTAAASFRVSKEEKSLFWRQRKCYNPRHEPSVNLLCLFEFPIIVSPPRQIECRAALKSWESESSSCSLSGSITFFSLSFSHSTSTSHRKWAGPGTTGSTRSLELCEVSMTRAKKRRLSERDQKSIFDAIVRARNARERFNSDSTFNPSSCRSLCRVYIVPQNWHSTSCSISVDAESPNEKQQNESLLNLFVSQSNGGTHTSFLHSTHKVPFHLIPFPLLSVCFCLLRSELSSHRDKLYHIHEFHLVFLLLSYRHFYVS